MRVKGQMAKSSKTASLLFAGCCVNVHALGAGQGLRLGLKTVGWGAGERADSLTALTAICHP